MEDRTAKYIVSLSDGTVAQLTEQEYNDSKDKIFGYDRGAQVAHINDYSFDDDIDDNASYTVGLPDGSFSVLNAQQFRDSREKLRGVEGLQFGSLSPVDYWGEKLDGINQQIAELEPLYEEALQKEVNLPVRDLASEEADPALAIQAVQERSSISTTRKELSNRLKNLKEEREANPAYQSQKQARIEGLQDYAEGLNKKMSDLNAQYPEASAVATSPLAGYGTGVAPVSSELRRSVQENPEYYRDNSALVAAKAWINDAEKAAKTPSRYDNSRNGFQNFITGVTSNLKELSTALTLAENLIKSAPLIETVKQIQKEEGDNANILQLVEEMKGNPEKMSYLSDAQKSLLEAFIIKTLTDAEVADYASLGYQAGQGAIASIGFMTDFLLFGGIGDAAASGVSRLAGRGAAKFAPEVAKAAFREGISKGTAVAIERAGLKGATEKVAQAIPEFAIGTVKNTVKALAMTPFMPSSYSNLLNNLTQIDAKDGTLDLSGKAILDAAGDVIIETLSENAGGQVESLLGVPFKALGAGTGKLFANTAFGRWGQAMRNAPVTQLLKQAGWNGFIGEMGEEWYGNAIRVMTGVDKDALKNFATIDQQLVTMASFAPMSIIGLGASTGQYLASRKQMSDAGERLTRVLAKNNYKEDQIRQILNVAQAENPQELADGLAPVVNQIARDNGDASEAYKAVADYAKAVAQYRVFDGRMSADAEQDREVMRSAITAQMSGDENNWVLHTTTQDDNGRETATDNVRTLTDAQGNEYFVTSSSEEGYGAVSRTDGSHVIVNPTQIEDGTYTDSGIMGMTDFLDREIARRKVAEDNVRMEQEQAVNRSEIYQMAQPGMQINIGSVENPVIGTVLQVQNDQFIIDSERGPQPYTLEQVGGFLKHPLQATPQSEIDERQSDAIKRVYDKKETINERIRSGNIVTLGGSPVVRVLSPDGATITAITRDGQNNPVETNISEAELDELMSQADNKPVADIKDEETPAPEPEDTTPRDFRGNPLPLKTRNGEQVVDWVTLWNRDPEAWAHYNDTLDNPIVDSKEKLAEAIKDLTKEQDKLSKDLRKEALHGMDENKMDAFQDRLAEVGTRLNQLQTVLNTYNRPAEAGQTIAGEQRQAQAEKTKREQQAGFPGIQQKWDDAEKIVGVADEIRLPNGESIAGHYVMTEAEAPTASHNPAQGFTMTEGFPVDENGKTVNDRDYEHDKAAQQSVLEKAANYDQRALQTPVIVSSDGVVLSGNDRTMASQIAAANNTDGAYLDYLNKYSQKYGFTAQQVAQFQHPRVVFVPDASMPYNAATFAKFNAEEKKSQNKTEKAVKAGKTLTPDALGALATLVDQYEDINALYNDANGVDQLLTILLGAEVISQEQVAALKDGNTLSGTGMDLLESTLIGAALDEEGVRIAMSDKAIRKSVVSAISQIIVGNTLADFSLRTELTDAIALIANGKRAKEIKFGETVQNYVRQQHLFEDDVLAEATVQMLADAINDRRTSYLKKVLSLYNRDAVESANGQMSLLTNDVPSRDAILRNVLEYLGYDTAIIYDTSERGAEQGAEQPAEPEPEEGQDASSLQGDEGSPAGQVSQYDRERAEVLLEQGNVGELAPYLTDEETAEFLRLYDAFEPYNEALGEAYTRLDADLKSKDKKVKKAAQEEIGRYEAEQEVAFEPVNAYTQALIEKYGLEEETGYQEPEETDEEEGFEEYDIEEELAEQEEPKQKKGKKSAKKGEKKAKKEEEKPYVVKGGASEATIAKQTYTQEEWEEFVYGYSSFTVFESKKTGERIQTYMVDDSHPIYKDHRVLVSRRLPDSDGQMSKDGHYTGPHTETYTTTDYILKYLKANKFKPVFDKSSKSYQNKPYKNKYGFWVNQHGVVMNPIRIELPSVKKGWANGSDTYYYQNDDGKWFAGGSASFGTGGGTLGVKRGPYDNKSAAIKATIDALERFRKAHAGNNSDLRDVDNLIRNLKTKTLPQALMEEGAVDNFTGVEFTASVYDEGFQGDLFSDEEATEQAPAEKKPKRKTTAKKAATNKAKPVQKDNVASEDEEEAEPKFVLEDEEGTPGNYHWVDERICTNPTFITLPGDDRLDAVPKVVLAEKDGNWYYNTYLTDDSGKGSSWGSLIPTFKGNYVPYQTREDAVKHAISYIRFVLDGEAKKQQNKFGETFNKAKELIDYLTKMELPQDEFGAGEQETETPAPAETKPQAPAYGSQNKIVTTDQYEELKRRMREKLGQLNAGFDPEVLSIGAQMATYHIEAGARQFIDFSKRMIKDLGDAIRPYLKAIYNGARDFPGMEELEPDMTPYDEVRATDVNAISIEGPDNEEQETAETIQGLEYLSRLDLYALLEDHIDKVMGGALTQGFNGFSLVDMIPIGSRAFGTAREDSDLDILVEYEGSAKEDSVFNVLNEEPLEIGGIKVDFFPIRSQESGTLTQWLQSHDNGRPVEKAPVQEVNTENFLGAVSDLANGKRNEVKLSDFAEKVGKSADNSVNLPPSLGGKADRHDYRAYITPEAKKLFEEKARNAGKKYAFPELSYLPYASIGGAIIPVEELETLPEVMEAEQRLKDIVQQAKEETGSEALQLTPEQLDEYANRLLGDQNGSFDENRTYTGPVAREKKAFIVIGRSAAGKSSVFADPLSRDNKARIIDSDIVKPWLENYNNGYGTNYVHPASALVANEALERAARLGENIVIPRIGGASVIAEIAIPLRAAGYEVNFYFNEVKAESSIMRAAARFAQTGRYLSLQYLKSIGDKPLNTYLNFANKTLGEALNELSETQIRELRGRIERLSGLEGGSTGEGRETGNGAGQGTLDGDLQGTLGAEELGRNLGLDLSSKLFHASEWKNNDVDFGEPPVTVWSSESGEPFPGTQNEQETEPAERTTLGELGKYTHTKTGKEMTIVRLSGDRLTKEEFKDLKARAKELGGYYSSFGSAKGFLFDNEADAIKFNNLETINNAEEETDEQTGADTTAIVSEAGALISQTETIIQTEEPSERRAAEAVSAIDESLDKINDQLALLGYYKADTTDESGWDEVYEYRRSAEKKAVKDADRLAKKLASDLGLEVGRKQLAKANIAPAGGDISFRLPLKEGHNLYVDIEVQPAEYDGNAGMGYSSDLVVRGVGTYSGRALDILYRLEIPAGEGKFKVGANNFLPANVTYADMLDELRKAVKDYLPEQAPAQAVSAETDILQVVKEQAEKSRKTAKKSVTSQEDGDSMMGDLFSDLAGEEETAPAPEESTAPAQRVKPTEMNGFAIGEKVLYTPSQGDRKTQQATIYDFEYDGRPVLDAGLAPILYEVVEWDTIKKLDEPVNTTDNGSERTDDERAQGTQADSIQSGGGAQETEGGNGEGERQEGGRTDTGRAGRSQSSERNSRHRFDDSVKRNTRNFRVAKGEAVYPKTAATRFRANIDAIRLLRELQDSGKQATKAQMAILGQFTGWGALGTYFNNTYDSAYKELASLLTGEEMQAAEQALNNSYYTPIEVIEPMWEVVKRLGFEGGNILEGSAGIGNILASMPKNISERSKITAVEKDLITGGILEQLYPDAEVHINGFEDTDIPNNSIDLAITNVPFGDLDVYDAKEKDLTRKFGGKIHDFCIAKNIRKLAEGGIGVFISTRGTLDNNSKALRQWITNEADTDFIGAFRLNNSSFIGTGATADIFVVRKRVNGKKSPNAIDVADTVITRKEEYELDDREWNPKTRSWEFIRGKAAMEINSYFVEHPENMGGEMGFGFEHGSDKFRATSSALWPSEKIDQNKRLAKWARQFSDMQAEEQAEAKQAETTEAEDSNATKEGQLVTNSKGEICVSRRGKAIPLGLNAQKVKGYSKAQVLADYDALKTAINEALDYQLKNESDEGLKPVLDKLNRAYDTFKRKYERLNKNTAITFLRNDVDFPSVAAVEGYKETKDINGKTTITVKKTDIFSKRVLGAKRVPTPKDTKDGVIISINQYGRIDIPFIADALNKSDEEVRQEIITSGLGFENPQTGNLEVDYEYLSGNVREKLDYAREHNEGGRYDKNIEALEKAVPTDIPAHLIEFSLGSDWMPVELYTRYAKEKLGANDNFVPANLGGSWVIGENTWDMGLNNEKNRSAGVTSEKLRMVKSGHELMIAAMNNSSVVFSRTYKDNLTGESHTEHDKEATQAAATKISEMRDDFKEWARGKMLEDPELAERVGKIYNNTFNAIVPKEISETFIPEHFEGQVLTMGKEGKPFHLYQHQSKAVIRATTEPLMMAHEVGSGKTFTLISSAMEMRRLGTAKKPMIVVQNATLGQFVSSAKELYPNAKVLTISEADRTVEGRSAFYAKIKYNDWDMIIVPQSVFEMIPDSEERQRAYIQEKIEEKEFILEQAKQAKNSTEERRLKQELEDLQYEYQFGEKPPKKGKGGKRDAKKEAEAKANAVAKAKKQLDRRTDEVADFDDMGIDALLIDEAHNYKHLGFSTAMQRGVKGVDSTGSKRSAGVYLKTRAVFDKVGWKNVVFATGTPISNTAAEIWTFMKYLMPAETMRKNHIYYFDDFVRNFGNIAQSLEFTTSGKFKENTRFASYTNLPELMRIWMSVADIVLTKEAVAAGGEKLDDKLPKMEGGQARDIYLPQSASLVDIMNAVRAKLEWYENLSGKEKKENSYIPLTMFGIAKMAAIDPRLVDKNAKDEPQSKTNKAVEETLKALEDSKKFNGTAALFCDNFRRWDYTESGKRVEGFNIFEEIGRKLIEAGVPADQIVIMKSGMTTAAKEKIFAKVNAGEIRVIMGSTETLGTGVNIQERLFFEAHIDAPNRPMDYTQRMGRILRQGNLLKDWGIEARVVRFGVEDSLDVTAYQRLSTKSKFIDSVMNGKALVANSMENRVLEEEEEGVFDNPVAVLSGSQYALLKSQAERELRKLRNKKEQHKQDQIYIEKALKDNNNRIEFNQKLIEEGKKNLEKTKEAFPDGKVKEIAIEGKKVKPDQIAATLKEKITGPLREYLEKNRDNSYFHDETKEYNMTFDGVLVKISVAVSRTSGYDERLRRFSNQMHALVEYSAPKLGINGRTVPGGVTGISGIIPDFQEKIASGSYYENGIRTMENTISRLTSDNDLMLQRRGKPFADEEKLKQQEEIVKDYTEKMKAEMAEKEAKYAEVAKNANTTFNLDNVEVEDEPQGEDSTSYRDVDENAPKLDVNDPFVLAEAVSAVNRLARRIGLRVNFDETLDAKGAYTEGNDYVSINLANCESVDDAIETLLHEGVAHLGLRKLFGKEGFTEFINDILDNSSRSIRDAIDNLVAENGWSREYAAEEYIAELAQRTDYNKMERSFWRRVVDAVRNLISMITGRPARITDGTIREMLLASYENLGVENNDIDFYNENWEGYTHFRERTKPAPKKTGIGYKVFYRGRDGKLYPPMVANPNGEATPVGVWLDADAAPVAGQSKTGRPKVKAGGKGTQGGSGTLAYRPGWHLGEIPYAIQFNRINPETGRKELFPRDFVWAEVEYAADRDWQKEADAEGMTEDGKYRHSYAGLKQVPEDGFYRYRTNPNPETDTWIITGAMKVNKVLTDEEVDNLVRAAGREPQLREGKDNSFRAIARDLHDRYENQNGEDKPWMSERELLEQAQSQLPYGIATKPLFAMIDEYNRLDEEDFNEGRRDFSGGEMKNLFDRFLSALRDLGNSTVRNRTAGVEMFISNAENAVNAISMEKATPQQWLKMIESKGGLKAGEDKWIGLSDWLKASQKKTLTKQEVQDYINQNKIQIEEDRYIDAEDIAADGFEWNKAIIKRFGKEVFDAYHFEWDDDREIEIWIEDEDKAAELYNKFHKELGIEHELFTKPTDDYYSSVDMRWLNEFGLRMAQYGDEQMEKQFGKTINPTRIDYTTYNLDNKREIALTVPTIESWRERDKIHFGDAGDGRAIAWIRFGDTTIDRENWESALEEQAEFAKAMKAKYGEDAIKHLSGEERDQLVRLIKKANKAASRKRVLVIDEIQSKRHQEGREKGYRTPEEDAAQREYAEAGDRLEEYRKEVVDNHRWESSLSPKDALIKLGNIRDKERNREAYSKVDEQFTTLARLIQNWNAAFDKVIKQEGSVPAAPFEKNWHELAMKRMLRYAAENGYDAVAWTTGEQQAERYNIGEQISSIVKHDGNKFSFVFPNGTQLDITTDDNGVVTEVIDDSLTHTHFEGQPLSAIVGKELANKMFSMGEHTELTGNDLRIGGEGMKGFYDDILPRFMNKYGKKWGVSVMDMELPIGEDGKEVMHAVEVTPEMRESVMQGQLMFRQGGNYSPSPVSYSESMGAKRLAANETASKFGIDIEFRPSSEMRFNGMPLAGRWINGKMYVCLEHCRDNNDVVRTVLHEGVGHNGLRRLIGDENMRDFCLDLFTSLPKAVRNKIATDAVNKYGGNMVSSVENFTANDVIREIGKDAMFESTEEWLAETSETIDYDNYRKNVWDIIRDALRRVLAKVGINVPLSTRDVKWLMVQSAFANHENDALVEARRQVVAKGLGMTLRQQAEVGEARQNARNRLATEALAPAARIYNKDVMNWMSRLHETWVDKDDSVHRLVNAIEKATGKKAAAFEDIRLALNQQSSKGLAAIEKFEREHYQPMMDAIKALMEEKGCDLKDIERYVMIKHALERNEVFAKRDAREYYEAIHDANVRKIQDSNLEKDEKDRLITKEDAKLSKHYTAIENGTDVKYAELREQDYGGLTSLFSEYDDIEPFRQGIESNEEYQARVLQARHPKFQYIDANGRPVVDMEQTERAAQEEVDNFENGHAKSVDKLWKEINGATKATLLHQYQANMLSRDQYTKVRDMFKYYVPLRGFADNTAEDMYDYYRSDQRNDFTPPLMKAKGRKTEAESPFGYIGSMASSGIAADMKNETKLALYYFVSNRAKNDLVNISEVWYEKTGEDKDGKSIFSPVYPPFKEDLSSDEAKKEYEEWEKAMIEKAQDGLAFKGRRKLDLHNSVINIDNRQKNSHIIKFKVGGKDMMMYINGNPRAAQAINNELNVEMSTDYQKVFGKVLRWFSGINTSYNPEFWLSNAQRDALFALMSVNVKEDTEYNRAFRKNFGSLLRRTLTPGAKGGAYSLKKKLDEGKLGDERLDKLYAEFVENGGVTGYTTLKNNEEWELELRKYTGDEKEAVKAVKTLFQKVQNFGEAIEQMTRFAAYMTSREQGKEVKDAVNDAKDLTVNFNRKGSGKAISFKEADRLRTKKGEKLTGLQKAFVVGASWIPVYGRRFIMFFNASTQGLNAMYKLFSKNPSKMAIWTAGYLALGVIQAALHAMLDDDDDYLDIPDYERRNNLLLGGNGVYLKWALPQEARVFYALGDMIVNHAMGREPHRNMVGELLAAAADIAPLNPTGGIAALAPSALTPVVEVALNRDYKGAKIFNDLKYLSDEERKQTPAYQKAFRGTGKPYIMISKFANWLSGGDYADAGWLNINPAAVEHIVQGATGGAGTTVGKFYRGTIGQIFGEDFMVRNTPFLSRILTVTDDRYRNAHTTDLFDYYKAEAEHTKKRIKTYEKNGDYDKLDKIYESEDYEIMLIYDSYKSILNWYNDELRYTEDNDERKELMREQDSIRKEMIQEISNIGNYD